MLAGETALAGAVRELREETGIVARPEELALLCAYVDGDTISHSYLLRRDVDAAEIVFQPGETVAARWVTLAELEAMVARPVGARPAGQRLPHVREKLRALLREGMDEAKSDQTES